MARTEVKWSAWLLTCFVLACQGRATQFTTTPPPPPQVVHTMPSGARLLVVARPTPGVTRLALFIDAGSRDADPPQIATLAAWLAAEQGGSDVEAMVYPDVTELSRPCESSQLEPCLRELARALAFRTPSETQLLSVRARLEDARRRALAADPGRSVDELAARALLGDAAAGFFPLGRAEDDAQLTAAAVAEHLQRHFGPQRVALVAVGDVEPDRLREVASSALSALPAAGAARAPRALELEDDPALHTALDERSSVGFALAAAGEAQLRAHVDTLARRLGPAEDGSRVAAHVFPVRGGALALVRVDGDAESWLARATRELVLLQRESVRLGTETGARADDLASLSRVHGLTFGSRGEDSSAAAIGELRFGAGALIPGAPGAGPRFKAQTDALDAQRQKRAEAAFAAALAIAEPRTSGEVGEYGAAVALDNGARITVEYAHGSYVAIAVRVAFGADQDPPELHGRSALLATLTASACAGMGADRLRGELARLRAELEPRVNAESYGVVLRVPLTEWRPALDLALRCVRSPSREPADFASAAVRLQARLAEHASELARRARAARLIAPRAPGMLAPWGDPGAIGNLSPRELLAAARAAELGARWSVAVVGAVPVAEATARVARRLADLPAGVLPRAAQPGQPEPTLFEGPAEHAAEAVTLLATWDARGDFAHRLGASVFASAMHAALVLTPGIDVEWQHADVYPAGAYAVLRLRASAELVPRLAADLEQLARSLDDAALAEALGTGLPLARAAESGAEAELRVRAEHRARARLGVRLAEPTEPGAQAVLAALRGAPVRLAVVR